MKIVKSPFRISFFGGSTDYEDFYNKHGSFIIGTTIDKFCYLSMRPRPKILSEENVIVYSKLQNVKTIEEIQNPLIKEILRYKNIDFNFELFTFSDIPSRTGLGGSSSFCVGLLYLINNLLNISNDKKTLANEAIHVERKILNESGGIQDQIWAAYGGLNTVEINQNGEFYVKPLSVTEEFKKYIEESLLLIYTNHQREQNEIAKSHENKDKLSILKIAKEAHSYFLKEDIKSIGKLMYESWKEKRSISNYITTGKIDVIVDDVMSHGAYGVKLLGSGGCGFVLTLCNPLVKQILTEKYKPYIMDIKLHNDGVTTIYQ
jgi:D-glycero-alpha-D-manno-heptose-7-phosphate kinase